MTRPQDLPSELVAAMTEWRRDFHRHPELGFQEVRTSRLIAERLAAFGLEVHTGIGGTGVVGVLRRGASNRAVGLRADIDALPIVEKNDFAHRSATDGVMHACGHDGHTAMLLGAAGHLAADGRFDGTAVFIFQPAEEHGRGAQAMIDDGLFERFGVDQVFGIHNMPGLPVGQLAVRTGPIMASEDNFEIVIHGAGGHASAPQNTIDPIVIAAEVVMALQTIVARGFGPSDAVVVSATEITTDGVRNVIPSTAWIRGDVRTFLPAHQQRVEALMRRIAAGVCAAHGATCEVEYGNSFVPTINTAEATDLVVRTARDVLGDGNVDPDCRPIGGAEDFARMLAVREGCFAFLGNGGDAGRGRGLHGQYYDFNDDALAPGAAWWVGLVEAALPAR
ncbi:MAG: M20 aminoacylase family protein [Thalassobaculum sp.]|uniref:M20 aminoacylase family protein n=1 Tax=Thalassobaculum sp. TaxID=2022740 RepID=UPI0032EB3280